MRLWLCLMLLTGLALAEVKSPRCGLVYSPPEGWVANKHGFNSPDQQVGVMVFDRLEGKPAARGLENLEELVLARVFTDLSVEEPAHPEQISGNQSWVMSGTGKLDGKPSQWRIVAFYGLQPLYFIELGYAADALQTHEPELTGFHESLRRL
jgi:hypothetical protein